MTLQQIYDLAILMGKKADPRGEKAVEKSTRKTASQVFCEMLLTPTSLLGDPRQ